jgi:ketosteroid isomerase-like protein
MDVAAWVERMRRAWEGADPDAAAALFATDAVYRSAPFREPSVGRDAVRQYWAAATSDQESASVRFGEPIVDGDRAAVEWWTTMREAGDDVTDAGVLFLAFGPDGRCRELREYWDVREGPGVDPFDGWGRVASSGSGEAAEWAARWAEGYERAWRSKDIEAAVALYAPDVVYRSHPFRDPRLGREGVRAYTADAFGEEENQDPRFGTPIAAGAAAAVEYWTPMQENGADMSLIGAVVLRFDPQGLVAESREYWFLAPGRHEPYPGWGT